jgi:hypothetical protein
MKKGFDAGTNLTTFAAPLATAGYSFVCRYYNVNNPAKNLTLSEAQTLSAAGLTIVSVWENGFPTSVDYFSHDKGVQDGQAAYQYAFSTIGQPQLTPIYFAVDYDASQDDIDGVISDYFKGVQEGFNTAGGGIPVFLIGVYGSGLVCSSLLAANLASYSWLAQSTGWRGSGTYTGYNIGQSGQITECIEQGGVTGDGDNSPNDNEGSFKV